MQQPLPPPWPPPWYGHPSYYVEVVQGPRRTGGRQRKLAREQRQQAQAAANSQAAEYAAAHAAANSQAAAHSRFQAEYAAAQAAGQSGYMVNHSPLPFLAYPHGTYPRPQQQLQVMPAPPQQPMMPAPAQVSVPAPAPTAVVAEMTAVPPTGPSNPELVGLPEAQVDRSAMLQRELLTQHEVQQQQQQMMHEQLTNIMRGMQNPLAGFDGAVTLSGWPTGDGMEELSTEGGSEVGGTPYALPALELLELAPTCAEGDDVFDTNIFEQTYPMHMVTYGASTAMAASLKYTSRECDGLVQYLFTALIVAFLSCFASRWVQHKLQQDHVLQTGFAHVSGAAISPAVVVPAAVLAISAFSLHMALSWKSSDLCRIGGSASDMWDTLLPTWYAHAGTLDMLFGLLLTTHNLQTSSKLVIGIGSHLMFAIGHLVLALPTADEATARGAHFIMLCHATQQLSFLLGCFLGHSLINGQRRFFDEAWTLRAKLLQKRCEQLQAEKERAVYDRQLLQQQGSLRMAELSAAHETERAVHDRQLLQQQGSELMAELSALRNDEVMSGISGSRASGRSTPAPLEAPPNPPAPLEAPPNARNSGSSAGLTELNLLVSASMEKSVEPSQKALDLDGTKPPPALNPKAREWAPPPNMGPSDAKDGA